jgi:hypothetical protein
MSKSPKRTAHVRAPHQPGDLVSPLNMDRSLFLALILIEPFQCLAQTPEPMEVRRAGSGLRRTAAWCRCGFQWLKQKMCLSVEL